MNNLISKLIIILILIMFIICLMNTIETYTDEHKCKFLPRHGKGTDQCNEACNVFSRLSPGDEAFTSCDPEVCNTICGECKDDRINHCSDITNSSGKIDSDFEEKIKLTIHNNKIVWTHKEPPLLEKYKIHITHQFNNFSHIFVTVNTITEADRELDLTPIIKDNEPYKITVYGFESISPKIKSNTLEYRSSNGSSTTQSTK